MDSDTSLVIWALGWTITNQLRQGNSREIFGVRGSAVEKNEFIFQYVEFKRCETEVSSGQAEILLWSSVARTA